MFKPARANTRAARGLIRAFGYLSAKRSVAADNPEFSSRTVQRAPDELFRVPARRCQERYEVAPVGVLDVVARSAMVPQQPSFRAGHRRRGSDELGGIRAQQNICCGGYPRQSPLEDPRVALI